MTLRSYPGYMLIGSSKPSLTTRPVSVTAFLDGNARMIEPPVMRGHDQFERASQNPPLDYHVTGQRREFSQGVVEGAGFLAGSGAIAALGAAVGAQFGPEAGICVGLFAVPPAFIGARRLQSAFTSKDFQPGPPADPSVLSERFSNSLEKARSGNPEGPQVAYISGHGSHKEIAHFKPQQLGAILNQNPVDLTVLDACNTAQLEVLSKLGAGAGDVVCSSHPVPAGGFPIESLFDSPDKLGQSTYSESKGSTAHLSLVDNKKLVDKLMPSLDELAKQLKKGLDSGTKKQIHRALTKSRNPDLFGARAGLRPFLQNLGKEDLSAPCKEALDASLNSLKEAVPQDTGWAVTFRVDGKENEALPPAWNGLFEELGYRWKPFF